MTPSFPTRRSSDLLVAAQQWPHRLVEGASLLVPRVGRPVELADATVDADPRQLGHQPSADTAGTRLAGDEQVLDEHRSEEHTSELQSLMRISYAVFCLKKKNKNYSNNTIHQ